MGLIERALGLVFGSGRNVVAETAEVFRVNAEAQAGREAQAQGAALAQMAQEFAQGRRSWFDRCIDGLNRLPRPAMALGTLALFVAAMIDPTWFAARMTGIALVPEPLWWLLGAVVSFYFGARHQAKGQDFRREIAATMAAAPEVAARLRDIEALRGKVPETAAEEPVAPPREMAVFGSTTTEEENAALVEWRRSG
ncbi:Holin of 3TMs, for gene-transfer release [Roseivivax marinus]|uniref:holin family protein n=1 Tax=Roseivivax marinus TaxID=1379903 RepID=UPI0008D77D5B|nr:holin family protein [Roseivivax marinus]SEL67336.1 Holin of 3TMs, for gene-transfer release [Roseivivax marinus]